MIDLDPNKNWSKVKAGFKDTLLFRSKAGMPQLKFVDACKHYPMEPSQPKGDVYSGKTFKAKRGR